MKTTPQMTAKWTKGAFLIILGIILLFYSGNFVKELEANAADEWNLSFDWTWDLLSWILWILIAWLFVDAALTIALSFKMDYHTIGDVMARLDEIEGRISPSGRQDSSEPSNLDDSHSQMAPEDELPPPT